MKLAAIVLAAGRSSRMGANKLLLRVGDKKVIEHIIDTLNPIDTIVVLGHRAEDIKNQVEGLRARTIVNHDYEKGMTISFQTGLKMINPETDAVYLVLGDTFGFKKSLLDNMRNIMESNREILLVSPRYKGKRGHPVLIHKTLFEEFLKLEDDETLKNVIKRYETQHKYIESDLWCIMDLDTREDYAKVLKLWEKKH